MEKAKRIWNWIRAIPRSFGRVLGLHHWTIPAVKGGFAIWAWAILAPIALLVLPELAWLAVPSEGGQSSDSFLSLQIQAGEFYSLSASLIVPVIYIILKERKSPVGFPGRNAFTIGVILILLLSLAMLVVRRVFQDVALADFWGTLSIWTAGAAGIIAFLAFVNDCSLASQPHKIQKAGEASSVSKMSSYLDRLGSPDTGGTS